MNPSDRLSLEAWTKYSSSRVNEPVDENERLHFSAGHTAGIRGALELAEYAQHKENCRMFRMDQVCTCGLREKLAQFKRAKGES